MQLHTGCTDTVRESALKVDCGRKIPCRTGESNLRLQRAGPMLYRLSYIPTLRFGDQQKLMPSFVSILITGITCVPRRRLRSAQIQ